jgi:hypothetical protein
MVWRLGLLTLVVLGLVGCSTDPGPNDPKMNAGEESKLRENTLTPEQQQARDSRPR